MALIKRSEIKVAGLCELPQDRYTARVRKSIKEDSKSSNRPLICWDCEFFGNPELLLNGSKYDLNGGTFNIRFMLDSDKGLVGLLETHIALGLPAEIDPELPNTKQHEGICFDVVLSVERQEMRKPATPEQAKAGQPGDIIKDAAGKPVLGAFNVNVWPNNILGRASQAVQELSRKNPVNTEK